MSRGYRPNKDATEAVRRVSYFVENEKRKWATVCGVEGRSKVVCDLVFQVLAEKIKSERLLFLIKLWVKKGKVDCLLRWRDNVGRSPQESVLSPLLTDFYLHPLDRAMTEKESGYVRYAGDLIVLNHSESEAHKALKEVRRFLERELKLKLSPESGVKRVQDGFEFLGVAFKDMERTISHEKALRLKVQINNAIELKREKSLKNLSEVLNEIRSYYGKVLSQSVLEKWGECEGAVIPLNLLRGYTDPLATTSL